MATNASNPKQSPISEMPAIISAEKKEEFLEGFRNSVAKRAYELFEELGCVDGNDLSHWLRAEDELCVRLPEVHESGAWYTVSAPLVGVPADHIKVSIEDGGALISAEKTMKHDMSGAEATELSSMYYAVRWPESVSPETASAYLKNGTLTLVARKAGAAEVSAGSAAESGNKPRSGSRRSRR